MKRVLLMLLVALLTLNCLAGCGKDKKPTNVDTPLTTEKLEQTQFPEATSSDNKDEEWGVQEMKVTEKNGVITTALIKFPHLTGIVRGTGKIAYQNDKSLVILDSERPTGSPSMPNDACEDVFPAYFEQTRAIIDSYRQMNYDNFEFTVSHKEIVTVNGYEMCKFTGKHTFTVKDVNTFEIKNLDINFVAYATKLNGNGAYVYWMVLDESEDQSLTKTIEEYADKMAKTLSE